MINSKRLSQVLIISMLTVACVDSDPTNRKEFEQSQIDGASEEKDQAQPHNDVRFVTQGDKKQVVASVEPQSKPSEQAVGDEQDYDSDTEALELSDTLDEPVSYVRQVAQTEGYVEWEVPNDLVYDSSELTIVKPDGERLTKQFAGGESMQVNEPLPDGLYKWESVVKPSIQPHVMEALLAIRESGDLQAQQNLISEFRASGDLQSEEEAKDNRRSGAFVVRDGVAEPTTSDVTGYQDTL